ncbi:RIP metalloprotease RseP, partial [Escherichia coli]|nr:RIP metalloprotease RseP [Escherichia coli]
NKTLHISVTPEAVKDEKKKTIGRFGSYAPTEKGVLSAVAYGATSTVDVTKAILTNLSKLVTGQFKLDMLSGPVGIYDMTDQVAKTGIV